MKLIKDKYKYKNEYLICIFIILIFSAYNIKEGFTSYINKSNRILKNNIQNINTYKDKYVRKFKSYMR